MLQSKKMMKLCAVSQRVVKPLYDGKQLKINVGDVARLRTNRHAYRSLRIDKGKAGAKKREAHHRDEPLSN